MHSVDEPLCAELMVANLVGFFAAFELSQWLSGAPTSEVGGQGMLAMAYVMGAVLYIQGKRWWRRAALRVAEHDLEG